MSNISLIYPLHPQTLESKVVDLEAELREEREVVSGLREQLNTESQKNTMMDGDLRTFKEEHLTAKNKVAMSVLLKTHATGMLHF